MRTLDRAEGKWQGILSALGVPSSVLNGKHQSCPVCGNGKDTYRFNVNHSLGQWFCNYCHGHNKLGLDFVKMFFRVDNKEALDMIDRVLGVGVNETKITKKDPRRLLNYIRKQRRNPDNDVIEYLKKRGLKPTSAISQASLNYWHNGKDYGKFEAMVCRVDNKNGNPETYHITYLKDGAKADLPVDRKLMTPVNTVTGGAIRLFDVARVIGIAEGVETALSCAKMFAMPVWATISANGLENFEVPEFVEKVVIFADNDENYIGQSAAFNCAKRLESQGIKAYVKVSRNNDFNDDLIEFLKNGNK